MRLVTVIVIATLIASCGKNADSEPSVGHLQSSQSVELTFDHFGQAIDLQNQRLAESGEPVKRSQSGSDIRLRLRNNSGFLISLTTSNMYVGPRMDPVTSADGRGHLAFSEGMEVNVVFGIEEPTAQRVPYGGDVISESWLPSGKSITFSVPREAFSNNRSVFVEYDVDRLADAPKKESGFRVYLRPKDLALYPQ